MTLLPDCRLHGARRRATTVPFGSVLMERVYCGNCGADGGLITAEWAGHVFYLCDNCVDVHGAIDMPEVSETAVRGG